MQKWYNWLEEMKKKDEKEKIEEMHQHKVAQLIKIAGGECRSLAQNLKEHRMEERVAYLGK